MTDLPPGWAWTTLGEVAETSLGKMLDRGKPRGLEAVPYLRNINVQWGRIELHDVLSMEMSSEEQQIFELRPGDLLVCEGGDIGRCAIWPGDPGYMAFQKALHRVRPLGGIDVRYIRWALEHMALSGQLLPYATGSTIKHLPQVQLRRLRLPIPPLAEQRRIVEALDDHLSRIDAGRTELRTATRRLSRLWHAVFLTATSHPRAAMVQLGEIVTGIRNGMFVSRAGTEPEGVPILRIGAVRPMRLDLSDLRYSRVHREQVAAQGFLLSPGDLVFTRYNGNHDLVGACAVVPAGIGDLTYPDKLIRVSINHHIAIPDYVAAACSVGPGREAIRRQVRTTAGQAGIAGRDLKRVPLTLPPLDEQRDAVRLLAEQAGVVDRLQANVRAAMTRADALRASLLRAAFVGRLVPQDPDDEPAELLLNRTRAEREALPRNRRAGRTRRHRD